MSDEPEDTTTTTKTELSPEQRALIEPVIPMAEAYLKSPPTLPGYSQVAPFNEKQRQAQRSLLGAAVPQQQVATEAADATSFLLSDVLDPASNPSLQGYIKAATDPIMETLTQSTLPAIRGTAITDNQFGSNRQGIAEGLASGEAAEAVGNTAATIASQGYGQGLDALTKGMALVPTVQAAQTQPALTQSAVGDTWYAMEQALLSEQAYRDIYEQMAPFLAAQEVAAMGSALPGGTAISTATNPSSTSPLAMALGGAATLGSILYPPAAPATAASNAVMQGMW